MTTTERVGLCPVSYCPCPSSPDLHFCPHCQVTGPSSRPIEHHHCYGRVGKAKSDPQGIVIICSFLHRQVSENVLGDAILPDKDGQRYYRVWNYRNEPILEHRFPWMTQGAAVSVAESSVGDDHAIGTQQPHLSGPDSVHGKAPTEDSPLSAVMVPAESGSVQLEEDSDDRRTTRARAADAGGDTPPDADTSGEGRPRVDSGHAGGQRQIRGTGLVSWRDAWRQRGRSLADDGATLRRLTDDWRWAVGDWLIAGEDVLGEEFYGECEAILGVQVEAIWDYLRVARAFPLVNRVDLPWSVHRVLAAARYSEAERLKGLTLAREQGLTGRELAKALTEGHVLPGHGCEEGHDWRCARCGVKQP